MTVSLRTAHTADLPAETRAAIRALADRVFENMTDDAFENALGGVHALLSDDGDLIGHASVVQRRILHGGRALRAGYVEAVVVREDKRRQGHGAALMAELERIVRAAYELGALGASPDGARLYEARGWLRWQGRSSVLAPEGTRPTPGKDGWIYVLPVAEQLDLTGDITCDWRPGELW